MNVSKTLSSAVAAATIVGAVGLAYAQSTNDPATPPADSSTTTTPATSPSTSRARPAEHDRAERQQQLVDCRRRRRRPRPLERHLGRRAVGRPAAEARP